MDSDRHWTTLTQYLTESLSTFLHLSAEDLEDATSYTLLKYWELARSEDKHDQLQALRIATLPDYRFVWARSRFLDYARSLKRHAAATLSEDFDVAADMQVEQNAFDNDILEQLRTVSDQLDSRSKLVLETIIDSALSGESESTLAQARGFEVQTYFYHKRNVLAVLRRLLRHNAVD